MSIIVIDPTTALAIRAAMDGPNGTREVGVINAAAAAFGGGNVIVTLYTASGTLLHTVVRSPWVLDTAGTPKRMLAGTVVSQSTHASGVPAYVMLRTAAGVAIFQLSAGVDQGDLTLLGSIDTAVRVDSGSLVLTAPTGLDTYIPVPGERLVLVTPAMLATAQLQRTAGTQMYRNLVSQTQGTIDLRKYRLAASCALMYRLTGAAEYLSRSIQYIDYLLAVEAETFIRDPLNCAGDPRDLRYDSGFSLPRTVDVAYTLDLLYDELSPLYRQRLAKWLMDWADYSNYDSTHPDSLVSVADKRRVSGYMTSVGGRIPYTTYPGKAGSNYYWKYLAASVGSFVAVDDTRAGMSGYEGPRYLWHRNNLLAKLNEQAYPGLSDDTDAGLGMGLFKEGSSYDSTGSLAAIFLPIATSGFIANPYTAAPQWFTQAPIARIASYMPGVTKRAHFGNQAANGDELIYTDRRKVLFAANLATTTAAQRAMLYTLLDRIPTFHYTIIAGAAMIEELCYRDMAAPRALDFALMDRSFYSNPGGISLHRTDPTDPDTSSIVFTGGRWEESHQFFSANGFLWWKGDGYCLPCANLYSHSGLIGSTAMHNTLTLTNSSNQMVGQYSAGTRPEHLKLWYQGGTSGYISGAFNIAQAYKYTRNLPTGWTSAPMDYVPYLTDYTRKWVFDEAADAFFVYDRAVLNPAKTPVMDRSYRWMHRTVGSTKFPTHTAPPELAGNAFCVRGLSTTYKTYGTVVSGATEIRTGALPLAVEGNTGYRDMTFVEVMVYGATATPDRVLTALQSAPESATAPRLVVSGLIQSTVGEPHRGFAIGDTVAMFGDTDTPTTVLTYEAAATTHYVTDCVPGRSYSVSVRNITSGTQEAGLVVAATAAGIVRFTSPTASAQRYVLE